MHSILLNAGRAAGIVAIVAACRAPQAQAQQWSLGPPEVVVGSEADSYLERVAGVVVWGDRIHVADEGAKQVLAFDRGSGRLVASAGREGNGPGEFRFLSWIGDCGSDTIFTWDGGHRRMSVFTGDLEHVRTLRMGAVDAVWTTFGCAGPDSFVGITRNRDPVIEAGEKIPMGETWRATHDIVLLDLDGSVQQVLKTFSGQERYREETPGGFSDYGHLWGLRVVFGSSASGFVLGTGEEPNLAVYGANGAVPGTLDTGLDRSPVSKGNVAARVQNRVERSERLRRDVAKTRTFHEEYPYPSHFPAYSRVLMTAGGSVWVKRFREPYTDRPSEWRIFDARGTLVGTLEVEKRFEIMWVGETHIAIRASDALGVQTVEVRRILRE